MHTVNVRGTPKKFVIVTTCNAGDKSGEEMGTTTASKEIWNVTANHPVIQATADEMEPK